MVHVPSAAEFVLRLVVAALDITILSIVIFCSARFHAHYILSYIAAGLMLFWCAATSLRTWGVFTGQLVSASLTVKNELFCMACGDFVFLVLFLVATLSVGLADGGTIALPDGDLGPQSLYMAHSWRMYTVWFQTAICALQFCVLVLACAGCCRAQRRPRAASPQIALAVH